MTATPARAVPHAPEAERALLGALLQWPEADPVAEACETLRAEDFFRDAHQRLWRAMHALRAAHLTIDPVSVLDALTRAGDLEAAGGADYLAELLDDVPTAAGAASYAAIIRERALERRLLAAGAALTELVHEGTRQGAELVGAAEQLILEATDDVLPSAAAVARELVWPVLEQVERRAQAPGHLLGVTTGSRDLDDLTAGLQAGDFVVLAARPSVGKTALGLQLALAAAGDGHPVLVFSLEMSRDQLVERMLANLAGVELKRLRTGHLYTDEYPKLSHAAGVLGTLPIVIDDAPSRTISALRTMARRLVRRHGIHCIVVDYLQLLHPAKERENQNQNVTEISKGLKALARELAVPVVVLCQLSRAPEARPDRKPKLADLRDSGSIEQDADAVGLLWNDPKLAERYTMPPLTVLLEKQRNGPTGVVHLAFDKAVMRLSDWVARERPDAAA